MPSAENLILQMDFTPTFCNRLYYVLFSLVIRLCFCINLISVFINKRRCSVSTPASKQKIAHGSVISIRRSSRLMYFLYKYSMQDFQKFLTLISIFDKVFNKPLDILLPLSLLLPSAHLS